MTTVHATAIVDKRAKLGANVTVGPYTVIDGDVEIGDGTTIGAHNVITGHTTIGCDNRIFHFASIGEANQDKKYKGEPTRLAIGDRNTIREYCSLNRGTVQEQGVTTVGSDNWIMAYCHVAHDCIVGNHTVFANHATLAGHVEIGDWTILGGFVGVHQFVKVGAHVMLGIASVVTQDVPPFLTVAGQPCAPHGINAEGLKRRGFTPEGIAALRRAYKTLYKSSLTLAEAKAELAAQAAESAEVRALLDFLGGSTRGILRLKRFTIGIVAGETSGDQLGAALIRALASRWQHLDFVGIAGPRMMGEGARTLYPMEKLAVRGYVEVLRHLPEILSIRRGIARTFLRDRPDLFIGIDAPDFNLGLETKLKAAGIPTVHYVSPSIWAWRAERIGAIGRAVSRMLVTFPFEAPIYEKAGIPVSYVGHPLADALPLKPNRVDARAQLRLAASLVPIALLPGSRMSELELHADLFIDAAAEISKRRPEVRFFVPLATRETRDYFETRLYVKEARELPIKILFGHATLALHAAEAAIVASGTATLEAALARCPMVITYRLNPTTYRMVKRKALLPYFGLPNILAGEFIVPELLQDDATPANLAQALGNWLDHKSAREALRGRFAAMHESLACGHEARLVDALAPYIEQSSRMPRAA